METREFFRRELLLAPFPPAHLLHSIQPLSTDLRVLPRPRACIRLLLNLVLCHLLFDFLSVNKPFAQFQLGAFSHLQFFSTLFATLCSAFSPPLPLSQCSFPLSFVFRASSTTHAIVISSSRVLAGDSSSCSKPNHRLPPPVCYQYKALITCGRHSIPADLPSTEFQPAQRKRS